MKNKPVVIHQNCHSRMSLSGIYNACRCKMKKNTSLNRYVEDPRQKPSGMTTNFTTARGFTTHSVTPTLRAAIYAGYSGRNGFTLGRHAELVSASSRSMKKEEALNKSSFRAPLRSGFTLIELLVVVLIIGILAAVAVPQYRIAVAKSRYATLKNLVESMVQAEEVFYLSNGEYTNNPSALDISFPTPNSTSSESKQTQTVVNYNWGFCKINIARIFCTNSTQENITYAHWFSHIGGENAGKRRCQIRETTDITDWRNAICKGETQDLSPVIESKNNQIVYYYQ